jgi:hypothetical protein
LYAVGVIDAEGYSEHAAKLLGMINFQLESVPDYLDVRGQKVLQWITALVHSHLDDAAFAAAWAEGPKLTLDQLVNETKRLLITENSADASCSTPRPVFGPHP